jgi:hypothetical protein
MQRGLRHGQGSGKQFRVCRPIRTWAETFPRKLITEFCEDVKLFTAILLLAPAYFIALGVLFASAGMAVVFASVIGLCSLACVAWGIRIFRSHRRLACVCFVVAAVYLVALALLLQPAKARGANKRAGVDTGFAALFHGAPGWRGTTEAQR